MTSAEFTARYQLREPIAPHAPRSLHAVQAGTGAPVVVHYLDDRSADERAATLRRIERLVPPASDLVLDITEVDGTVVVVTQPLANGATLDAWLDPTGSGRSTESGAAVPAPEQRGARTPGEFTRLFKSPVAAAPASTPPASTPPAAVPPASTPPAASPPPPSAPAPARAAPPPPPAPQPAAPGEFTRIFQAPHATPVSNPALRPPPAPPAPAAPVGGADAMKPRVTMRPSAPEPLWNTPIGGGAPSPSPVPPLGASGPAFPAPTMPPPPPAPTIPPVMTGPASAPPAWPSAPVVPSAPVPPSAPVLPQAPAVPPAPTLPPTPAQPSPVSATGALRAQVPPLQGAAPSIIPLPPLAPPPSAAPAAPVAPVAAGPSAFTRVISAPARPETPPPAEPPAPPPDQQPAPATRSYLPLILVLNIVLVGVVAIILYFALKH